MAAYVELVQQTKNTRLKYLLSQTDEYIAIINRMVKDQRTDTGGRGRGRRKVVVDDASSEKVCAYRKIPIDTWICVYVHECTQL